MKRIAAYKISCDDRIFLTEQDARNALNNVISKKLHNIADKLACKQAYGIIKSFEDKELRKLLKNVLALIEEDEAGIPQEDEED